MPALLMETCRTYAEMWTVFGVLNLWALLGTVSSSPPSPTNVSFSSVNLRNVVHWFPGNGSADDTQFTVEYAIYGDSTEGSKGRRVNWRLVRQCTEIVRTWCDVSMETENEEQGYYARVRAVRRKASSKWTVTRRRFDPKSDTSLGPPLVHVEIENNSAIITLKGPMRYRPKSHNSPLSMAAIYPQMTYKLSINNTHRNRIDNFSVDTGQYKYRLMDYNTQYCFSAQSKFLSMPIHCHSSAWHCVTTPQDPMIKKFTHVIVGIVVPTVCIAVIGAIVYILYQYLSGKGQKTPYILNLLSFHPAPATFYPGKLDHMSISVIKEEPPSDPVSLNVPPHPQCSLSPQHRPREAAGPQEPLDDMSDDYGFVAAAGTGGTEEENEKNPGEENGGRCEHQTCKVADKKALRGDVDHCVECSPVQESSYLLQGLCGKTSRPTQMDANRKKSSFVEARKGSQINLELRTPVQASFQSFQRFEGTGRGDERNGKEPVCTDREEKIDEGLNNLGNPESVPLISGYASQNTRNKPIFSSKEFNDLPNDYGVLSAAPTDKTNKDGFDFESEEEQGCIFVNWNPETKKLVLPEFQTGCGKKEQCDGGMSGEAEDPYEKKGELRLEYVYVRQGSEEKAEAERQLERGGETGMAMGDSLSKWNVVVCMDD